MGLDVGQETVSGWTMKSNFDTAVDKVGWGVIGDGARLGAGWARGAAGARIASSRCSRATTRCARAVPRARDAPKRARPDAARGAKKPQVFGGSWDKCAPSSPGRSHPGPSWRMPWPTVNWEVDDAVSE